MATDFPGALDNFSNPSPSTRTRSGNPLLRHARQHSDANDAIEAIQAKVGVDGSAVSSSLDYRISTLETSLDIVGRIIVPPSASAGTAINAAIADLPTNGGTIQLEGGTYTLDTAVLINKNVQFIGVGDLATRVQFDGASVSAAFAMSDTNQRRVVFRDMRIESTTNGSGTAINANYFVNSKFENLRIGSSTLGPNKGIVFGVVGTYYNIVEGCTIHVNGTNPIAIEFSSNANSNMVSNTKALTSGTGAKGVYVDGAHSILIDHLDVEGGGFIAVDITATAADVTMVGCYFETCTIGLRMAAGSESVRYIGGYISTSSTANIQDNGCVGFTTDNAWVEFNPYDSIDRRNVAKYQVNQRDVPSCEWQPDDLSAIAWAFDPASISNTHTTVSGTLYLVRLNLRYPKTITNILFGVTTAATVVTANQNFAALYNSAGTRVAVSTAGAMDVPIASTGFKAIPLSSTYAAAAGTYWAALLFNAGGTQAVLARGQGASLTIPNMGLTAASFRFAVNGTGLTSTPASITPASNSITGAGTIWAGAS